MAATTSLHSPNVRMFFWSAQQRAFGLVSHLFFKIILQSLLCCWCALAYSLAVRVAGVLDGRDTDAGKSLFTRTQGFLIGNPGPLLHVLV